MGQLEQIVDVAISTNTATATRPGFGTPLVAAYFPASVWGGSTDRVRTYTDLSSAEADGVVSSSATTKHAYTALAAIFSQDPRPERVKLARRAGVADVTLRLYPLATTSGYPSGYTFTITVDGTVVSSAIATGQTVAQICTTVQALGAWPVPLTVTATATYVQIKGDTAGQAIAVSAWNAETVFADETPDPTPSMATDLAAIKAADSDWYGLTITETGKILNLAAAAWCETDGVAFFNAVTSDSNVLDNAVTTDTVSALRALAYKRTNVAYRNKNNFTLFGSAWQGAMLPKDVGSATWEFKQLSGQVADTLSDTNVTTLETKGASYYQTVAGISITRNSVTAKSATYWIDLTQGEDWLKSEMKTRTFERLANSDKVPFTTPGIRIIESIVKGVLTDAVERSILSGDPAPKVIPQNVTDVPTADKAGRILRDVDFEAYFAGAIHKVRIRGKVSV
jgi:hypothetical protein